MVKSQMNKSAFSFGAKELCFKFCPSSAIERRTSDFNSRLYVLFFSGAIHPRRVFQVQ